MNRTLGMGMTLRIAAAACIVAAALPWPAALAAQEAAAARSAAIHGVVIDGQTGAPVAGAYVRIREMGRNELSHRDGSFHFERLAPGTYTVMAQRIGYAPVELAVVVRERTTETVTLSLASSAISIPGVVVTGTGRERGADEVYRPTTVLNGAELRRRLGSSVAATLADEPGIAQRYNGPAAAQPVVRGLSGDRVLVLEDGLRTGDVATTAADHAIAIEPLTAERIEVVRGPAGLLYGSNALGGVINVIRDEVPRTLPERLTGTLSAQAESVNRGVTGGGALTVPIGHVALRAELSGRTASDTRTPLGMLPATEMDGHNAALGASWIGSGGFVGGSLRDYGMTYGVPGSFNGIVIPGAHPDGVSVELRRTAARLQGARLTGVGPFSSVEAEGNYVRFEQNEIEPGGFVGTRFGQLLGTANLIARHRHEGATLFSEGAFGASFLGRDLNVAGTSTGTRPARQLSLAGFAFEELGIAPFRLQVGGRYDWNRITPRGTGTLEGVRERSFGAVSGSAAALVDVAPGVTIGAGAARAFRTPSIEELFSDGPHLADYSYNIGNPELDAEFGAGLDAFVRLNRSRVRAEASVFRNAISNYIYYEALVDPVTGDRIRDPRFGRWDVFQARQDNSVLAGAEGRVQWEALRGLVLDASGAYVRGTRSGDGEPLPAIPPLRGSAGARYDTPLWFVGLGWEGSSAQERVSAFELTTPGYGLINASAGLRWGAGGQFHSLTLQLRNAADEVWRDHLSRVRTVAPQPGRNVQLLYRVSF